MMIFTHKWKKSQNNSETQSGILYFRIKSSEFQSQEILIIKMPFTDIKYPI